VTSLTIRRRIAGPIERIFDAWTRAELLVQWWGPAGVRCIGAEIDARPGGTYRIGNELPGGAIVWIAGTFEIVERPHRLVYSWQLGDEAPSRVTIELVRLAERETEVVIVHDRVASAAERDGHERGWEGCLDGLARWAP
jgi:uncharacterized protein YndB with AHSA1/START domain